MAEPQLIPLRYLKRIEVRGETRWTGQVTLPGHTPRKVVVLMVKGRLLAVTNRCPHHGVPMEDGIFDEAACTLECPSHGWQLSLDCSDLSPMEVAETEDGLAVLYPSVR